MLRELQVKNKNLCETLCFLCFYVVNISNGEQNQYYPTGLRNRLLSALIW